MRSRPIPHGSNVFDEYVTEREGLLVTRRCPYCGEAVQDGLDQDILFVLHIGKPTRKHLKNANWKEGSGRPRVSNRF